MTPLRLLLVALLAANGLFWGLFSHGTHCSVARALGAPGCPPHEYHVAFGVAAFLAAVAVAQWGRL